MFVRNDTVRSALQPLYDGPNEVRKKKKYYLIKFNNRTSKISMDRLKSTLLLTQDDDEPSAIKLSIELLILGCVSEVIRVRILFKL